MGWIDEIRDPVADVAKRLGYAVGRAQSAHHCKCPVCGAEKRHRKAGDRRGAVGMPHAKPMAWRCHQCDSGGDSLDFVSYVLGGARFRELAAESRDAVRAWFGSQPDDRPTVRVARQAVRPVQLENLEAEYTPLVDVDAFWSSCVAVDQDAEVLDYLAFRSIAPAGKLEEHDCVRVLPPGAACPAWASFGGRPWSESGHRLIVPLYDCMGVMRSVVARSVEHEPRRKSLGAAGYGRRGLVMAGSYGRELLLTGAQAHWHRLERLRLTIHEGEVDWLRAVASGADDMLEEDYRPAAFRAAIGIFAGSFTRDIAWRIPRGTTVVIATDDDEPGDKYAAEIRERLGEEHFAYERIRMKQDKPAEGVE